MAFTAPTRLLQYSWSVAAAGKSAAIPTIAVWRIGLPARGGVDDGGGSRVAPGEFAEETQRALVGADHLNAAPGVVGDEFGRDHARVRAERSPRSPMHGDGTVPALLRPACGHGVE